MHTDSTVFLTTACCRRWGTGYRYTVWKAKAHLNLILTGGWRGGGVESVLSVYGAKVERDKLSPERKFCYCGTWAWPDPDLEYVDWRVWMKTLNGNRITDLESEGLNGNQIRTWPWWADLDLDLDLESRPNLKGEPQIKSNKLHRCSSWGDSTYPHYKLTVSKMVGRSDLIS